MYNTNFPFPDMVLWIILALSRSETLPPGLLHRITQQDCGSEGICAACAAASGDAYPYWNGEYCVSCSAGAGRESQMFDKKRSACTSACPDDAPWEGDDRVCRECPE